MRVDVDGWLSSTTDKKDLKELVRVTRAEADVLRQKAPNAHITIVNKGHSYKGYFVEESRDAKRVLGELRGALPPRERSRGPRGNRRNNNHRPRRPASN